LEGKLTLPLILLMRKKRQAQKDLEKIIYDGNYNAISRASLLEKLESLDLLAETRQRAYLYADLAIKNLELFPKTEYRLALEEIPSYMIERNK
jgi:geranylgeranyl pyrophosphate synthase